jgi:hypothetical protein
MAIMMEYVNEKAKRRAIIGETTNVTKDNTNN